MRYDILTWIWQESEGHPYMGTIDHTQGGAYSEAPLTHGQEFPKQETPGQDLFFSPLTFAGPRSNDTAISLQVLFADLDHMNFRLLNKIPPHVLWQTGPSTTQGLWKLDAPIKDYSAWADLNQRMTYFMDADRGGWAGSKMLRVPESINYKYDPPFKGEVLHYQPVGGYAAEALRDKLPIVAKYTDNVYSEHPDLLDADEWSALLRKLWPQLSLGSRSFLMQPSARDRSRFLVGVANKLRAEGHDATTVFHLVWGAEWNKFRTDRFRPDYVWELVNWTPPKRP